MFVEDVCQHPLNYIDEINRTKSDSFTTSSYLNLKFYFFLLKFLAFWSMEKIEKYEQC